MCGIGGGTALNLRVSFVIESSLLIDCKIKEGEHLHG